MTIDLNVIITMVMLCMVVHELKKEERKQLGGFVVVVQIKREAAAPLFHVGYHPSFVINSIAEQKIYIRHVDHLHVC